MDKRVETSEVEKLATVADRRYRAQFEMGFRPIARRSTATCQYNGYLPHNDYLFEGGVLVAEALLVAGATAEGALVSDSSLGMAWSELVLRMP